MFPKDSMFGPYKKLLNLKDLMVHAYSYSIKPLKETDQVPCSSGCMKRCDSCKNFVDHISSFECFATKNKLKSKDISHAPHQLCPKCGKTCVG